MQYPPAHHQHWPSSFLSSNHDEIPSLESSSSCLSFILKTGFFGQQAKSLASSQDYRNWTILMISTIITWISMMVMIQYLSFSHVSHDLPLIPYLIFLPSFPPVFPAFLSFPVLLCRNDDDYVFVMTWNCDEEEDGFYLMRWTLGQNNLFIQCLQEKLEKKMLMRNWCYKKSISSGHPHEPSTASLMIQLTVEKKMMMTIRNGGNLHVTVIWDEIHVSSLWVLQQLDHQKIRKYSQKVFHPLSLSLSHLMSFPLFQSKSLILLVLSPQDWVIQREKNSKSVKIILIILFSPLLSPHSVYRKWFVDYDDVMYVCYAVWISSFSPPHNEKAKNIRSDQNIPFIP